MSVQDKKPTSWQGIPVRIQLSKDSFREGKDAEGKLWSVKLTADYGYIPGTKGNDGDAIDCYLGNNPKSETVYVINQHSPSGRFDEHKVMLGFTSREEALNTYFENNTIAKKLFGSAETLTVKQFKHWLKAGSKQRKISVGTVKYKSANPGLDPKRAEVFKSLLQARLKKFYLNHTESFPSKQNLQLEKFKALLTVRFKMFYELNSFEEKRF